MAGVVLDRNVPDMTPVHKICGEIKDVFGPDGKKIDSHELLDRFVIVEPLGILRNLCVRPGVNGDTELAEGASVEGNLSGESLEIAGSLLGDARASGAIAVLSSAQIRGELRGSQISIEAGARVSVRLETEFELDFGTTHKRR